jgi:hypothetical protein
MTMLDHLRTMDRRLRVMLVATVLLIVPQIGQFVTIRDLNTAGRESGLAILLSFTALFIVPTSLILSGTVTGVVRRHWRAHQNLLILAVTNTLIALNLAWFFASPCSWSHLVGISLQTCAP